MAVETAGMLARFLNVPEAGIPEYFLHITEIEGGPVLSVAENEVGESASKRVEVTGKAVGKPVTSVLFVGNNSAGQVGHNEPDASARFQDA